MSSFLQYAVSFLRNNMITIFLRIGAVVSGLVAIAGGVLYYKQDRLLYFPEIAGNIPRHNKDNPKGFRTPAYHNWPYEEHQLVCSDGVNIHTWLLLGDVESTNQSTQTTLLSKTSTNRNRKVKAIPSSSTKIRKLPTIVFFHGNAGNIGLRLPNAIQMMLQLKRQFHVLLVEYRGYGDSDTVQPNEKGIHLDAIAALQFCYNHPNIDNNHIFLFGRSLGGAVAFYLANHVLEQQQLQPKSIIETTTTNGDDDDGTSTTKPINYHQIRIAGIFVENTFLSISAMVDHLMPKFIQLLKPLVLRMKWDNEKMVPNIVRLNNNLPILFLVGGKDELVPSIHMQELYKLAGNHGQLYVVPKGTHNDTWMVGGQDYWDVVRRFLFNIVNKKS